MDISRAKDILDYWFPNNGGLVLPWNGLGDSRGIALDATVSYIAGTQH
tara:strand:+ start:2192 stop:2335 length:144 start_codon:yes stop_codon:yes gene_type:complete